VVLDDFKIKGFFDEIVSRDQMLQMGYSFLSLIFDAATLTRSTLYMYVFCIGFQADVAVQTVKPTQPWCYIL
jgi:esterase/lipase superfamily enzyme